MLERAGVFIGLLAGILRRVDAQAVGPFPREVTLILPVHQRRDRQGDDRADGGQRHVFLCIPGSPCVRTQATPGIRPWS